MKLKISCYEPAVGRINLRRFAPVTLMYLIGMALLTVSCLTDTNRDPMQAVLNLQYLSPPTAAVNLVYAAVLAQLLFGDLYSSRLCNSLHTLPMTRGSWFGTQIIQGILASLLPNLLCACLMLLFVTEFRITILWWLVSAELQFLIFYSIAVLSAVCAGNRLGMLLLYAIANSVGAFAVWLRAQLFSPLVFGVQASDSDTIFCPILWLTGRLPFRITRVFHSTPVYSHADYARYWSVESIGLSQTFWQMLAYAAVCCLGIWLALRLYQKRRLECAGDLLAYPKMAKAILVLTTLCAGSAANVAAYLFNWSLSYLFLALGLVVGYYVCLMLLNRKVNVFRARSLTTLGVIFAVTLVSLTLTGLDVLGLSERIPDPDKIDSVAIFVSTDNSGRIDTSNPEEIALARSVHSQILEEHRQIEAKRPLLERIFGSENRQIFYYRPETNVPEQSASFRLEYRLKDGSTLNRSYDLHESGEYISQLAQRYSQPDLVFSLFDGTTYLDDDGSYDTFLDKCSLLQLCCYHDLGSASGATFFNITERQEQESLMEAILADCKAGNMAQATVFHPGECAYDRLSFYFQAENVNSDSPYSQHFSLAIQPCAGNTLAWFQAHAGHILPDGSPDKSTVIPITTDIPIG